jgi:hypothetical protein
VRGWRAHPLTPVMALPVAAGETSLQRSLPNAKEPLMTLTELKGKYAREFVAFRRRAETAPTLRDVVSWIEPFPRRQNGFGHQQALAG